MKNNSNNYILSYTEKTNKKWSWKLVDKDWNGEDFAAALEVDLSLVKVEQQGKSYWLVTDLAASPQSIKGFPLEITLLQITYKEQEAVFAMELDIQFKLSTATVKKHLDTGFGNTLTKKEQEQILEVLFDSNKGLPTGFELEHIWTKGEELSENTPTLMRKFLLLNKDETLHISKISANAASVVTDIKDPGMDGIFGGKADWQVYTNDDSFCQPLY
jgi:hypothetical protein